MIKSKALSIVLLALLLLAADMARRVVIEHFENRCIVRQDAKTLLQSALHDPPKTLQAADLAGLPAPVKRYFQYALGAQRSLPRSVSYVAEGAFRCPRSERDLYMRARVYMRADDPSYVCDALMCGKPVKGAWAMIRSKYGEGKGELQVNAFSALNIFEETSEPRLNRTKLLYFISKGALLPSALLPSPYLSWRQVDNDSALMKVSHAGNQGQVLVHFNRTGQITRLEAKGFHEKVGRGRYRVIDLTEVRSDYREFGALLVPTKFRLERTMRDGTTECFWRGEIKQLAFDRDSLY